MKDYKGSVVVIIRVTRYVKGKNFMTILSIILNNDDNSLRTNRWWCKGWHGNLSKLRNLLPLFLLLEKRLTKRLFLSSEVYIVKKKCTYIHDNRRGRKVAKGY